MESEEELLCLLKELGIDDIASTLDSNMQAIVQEVMAESPICPSEATTQSELLQYSTDSNSKEYRLLLESFMQKMGFNDLASTLETATDLLGNSTQPSSTLASTAPPPSVPGRGYDGLPTDQGPFSTHIRPQHPGPLGIQVLMANLI